MLRRSTVIIPDFLSERRIRDEAAREGRLGVQVLGLPGLAARLAGGFQRAAGAAELRALLQEPPTEKLAGLARIAELPGFARAAVSSLFGAWQAGINLVEEARKPGAHERWDELALLEEHLREKLPPGRLLLSELVQLALENSGSAAVQLGPVTLELLADVPPVYRPLLEQIATQTEVRWVIPSGITPPWTPAAIRIERTTETNPHVQVESCADPAYEALEALRWARRLLSSGVPAADIAIGTTSVAAYDESIQELAAAGGLPLYAAHGQAALNTAA